PPAAASGWAALGAAGVADEAAPSAALPAALPRPGPPLPSVSGGVGSPAGFLGSKNPAGLGMLETSSMPFAATPASCSPAFSPTRGSVLAAGCCCARPCACVAITASVAQSAQTNASARLTCRRVESDVMNVNLVVGLMKGYVSISQCAWGPTPTRFYA